MFSKCPKEATAVLIEILSFQIGTENHQISGLLLKEHLIPSHSNDCLRLYGSASLVSSAAVQDSSTNST